MASCGHFLANIHQPSFNHYQTCVVQAVILDSILADLEENGWRLESSQHYNNRRPAEAGRPSYLAIFLRVGAREQGMEDDDRLV